MEFSYLVGSIFKIPMKKKQILLLLLVVAAALPLKAQQTIRGFITDSITAEPLFGAVAYFNGTSIGTPVNEEGYFELSIPEGFTAPLVVSFMGYEKLLYQAPFPKEPMQIKLRPSLNQLGTVVVDSRTRTLQNNPSGEKERELVMELMDRDWFALFSQVFLGEGKGTSDTYISNKEVLEYRYDGLHQIIEVSARAPIIIENEYLRYRISYNLDSFQFQLKKKGESLEPVSYSLAGTSFFLDRLEQERTSKRRKEKIEERRKEAFLGSNFHFMQALVANSLRKAGFDVYAFDSQTNQKIRPDFRRVAARPFIRVTAPETFYVKYKGQESRIVSKESSFKVDEFGNVHPWDAVRYDGHMGTAGMSSAVPLNYQAAPEKGTSGESGATLTD